MRILIISNESDLKTLTEAVVGEQAEPVAVVANAKIGLQRVKEERFDLVIIEQTQVPGETASHISQLREVLTAQTHMLVVIADTPRPMIPRLVEAGADDFIRRPFDADAFQARLVIILRRIAPRVGGRTQAFGDFTFSLDQRTLFWRGNEVATTDKEFDLALLLFRNGGKVISRSQIMEVVWGQTANAATRTIDTHVCRVRRKLKLVPDRGYRLVSVYSAGYRLDPISLPPPDVR